MKSFKTLFLILSGILILSSCQKELSLETGATFGGLAVGSIKDTSGNCFPISVVGTYKVNEALTDSNYVILQVFVSTPGNYKITTDSINGYQFKDSGFFAATGMQAIKLKASGRPVSATQSFFSVSYGSGFCSFTVNATATTGGGGGGTGGGGTVTDPNISDTAWQFSEGGKAFKGFFDTIYIQNIAGLGNVLSIEGYTAATADTAMYIDILLPGSTVQPGTYVTIATASFVFLKDTSNVYYEANPTMSGATMQIVISSYDATTKILTGVFSGTAKTATGVTVNITNGRFKGKLN